MLPVRLTRLLYAARSVQRAACRPPRVVPAARSVRSAAVPAADPARAASSAGPVRVAATSVSVRVAAVLAVVALAAGAAGCGSGAGRIGRSQSGNADDQVAVPPSSPARVFGDGSTSDTGPQPHQPVPYRLVTGEVPPQFVVFSFDGAAEDGRRLFSRFRAAGVRSDAAMTYFLSGVSLLPAGRADLYVPPGDAARPAGLGDGDLKSIAATLREMRLTWRDGSEIGTSFNARTCAQAAAGSGRWTPAEWGSEIRQAESFVTRWKSNSRLVDEDPLPFDYAKVLAGGRAPCPGGGTGLLPAAKAAGFRYDASGTGGRQVWPARAGGVWEFPLPSVPVPGGTREAAATDAGPLGASLGRQQVHDAFAAAFQRAYRGNRAPLFVGAHLAAAGDAYLQGVEDTMKDVCARPGVRCVSFKQLADWLDAQDPRVLARLRTLAVGQAPAPGWKEFVAAAKR